MRQFPQNNFGAPSAKTYAKSEKVKGHKSWAGILF